MKRFMIIEHFRKGKVKALYERFERKGRMLPKGVKYIDSWIDENVENCYQLIESETVEQVKEWTAQWDDLVEFIIVPIISTDEAKQKVSLL